MSNHPFRILAAVSLLLLGCSYDDEENKCDYQPSDCAAVDTLSGSVNLELTFDALNSEVPLIIYRGTAESGEAVFNGTVDSMHCSFLFRSGYYSVKARYLWHYRDTVVTIYSVDGGSLESGSTDYCEGPCYDAPGSLTLKAVLDTSLFMAKEQKPPR